MHTQIVSKKAVLFDHQYKVIKVLSILPKVKESFKWKIKYRRLKSQQYH